MTSQVIIRCPVGNHKNVRVEGRYIRAGADGRPEPHFGVAAYYTEILTDGQETALWIHDSACVVSFEVPKSPQPEALTGQEAAADGERNGADQGKILQPDELPAPGASLRFAHEDRPLAPSDPEGESVV